jgi:CBS domain-containing protein
MRTLQDYNYRKLVSCGPDDTVFYAARLMDDRKVGCVVVTKDSDLVGIATRYDFIHSLIANDQAKDARSTKIREIMHAGPVTISASSKMTDALKVMVEKKVERLVVCSGENRKMILGVISLEDVVASLGNETFHSDKEYQIIMDIVRRLTPLLLARYDGEEKEELTREMNNELKALERLLEEAEISLRS